MAKIRSTHGPRQMRVSGDPIWCPTGPWHRRRRGAHLGAVEGGVEMGTEAMTRQRVLSKGSASLRGHVGPTLERKKRGKVSHRWRAQKREEPA
jgi:hypothetical protein